MSAASPFTRRGVLALLVIGALLFLGALWAIGAGETGQSETDGQGHAGANGLNGYSAWSRLLEKRGYDVARGRDEGLLDDANLLILTPPLYMEPEDLARIIDNRRYYGPTLVVLPKWPTAPLPERSDLETGDGWVQLGEPQRAGWIGQMPDGSALATLSPDAERPATDERWSGLGLSGPLTTDIRVAGEADTRLLAPLVRDGQDRALAGYIRDNGYYEVLGELSGVPSFGEDEGLWPVVVVVEPDLVNNLGLARADRARLAIALVDAAQDGGDLPIVFDLTLNGLGAKSNLLTLALTPPFLAATLCLLLAGVLLAWRAFHRFGPAMSSGPAIAFGKHQLVTNNATLVMRSGRTRLLGAPYAASWLNRVARALGIPATRTHADAGGLLTEAQRRLHRLREPDAPADQPDLTSIYRALIDARDDNELISAARKAADVERIVHR
jgi:hypothetical protein